MPVAVLKKSKIPGLYTTWQCCACSQTPRKRLKTDPSFQSRTYADYKTKKYEFRDNMNWPCRSAPWTPSPYEIFDLDRKANYTKHKYYELVKIYHPDRSGSCGDLTHVERLERYRLVVQAHEILSDPIKRRAFDSTGAGWGERNATRYTRGYSSADGKTYGHGPEHDSTIFNNATWEDWERWYRRNDNPSKQAYGGTYVHPNAFASFVIILAVISGILQATRAGQYSGKLEEKARAFTEETSRFMADRADHFQEHQVTREGRIKHFLEKRDPSKYGLKDEEEEAYRNHFGDTLSATPRLDDSSS